MFDTVKPSIQNGAAGNTYVGEIPSFDLLVVSDAYNILPDGTIYPPTIGNLASGAPDFNQSWSHVGPRFSGTLLTSSIFGQGRSPSSSYGMQVGSATMGIPGSFNLGGYDKSQLDLCPVNHSQ